MKGGRQGADDEGGSEQLPEGARAPRAPEPRRIFLTGGPRDQCRWRCSSTAVLNADLTVRSVKRQDRPVQAMCDVWRSAAAGIQDVTIASEMLGGAGRMPGRECGQLCSSTAGLDTDLLMRRGAVLRVEAEARATTAQEQAKPRIYSTCTRERQGQVSASICGLHSCSRLCANAAWGTLEETRPSSGHDTHANCGTDAGWCLLETETQRPAAKTHSAASWLARRGLRHA